MSDLFGNPDRLATAQASATAVDLFTATAERIAYEGGRNVAQVRAEVVSGDGIALAYCAACRCTDLPPIGKHIRAVSPDACHPCVRCGDQSLGRPCDHCGDPRPTRQTCGTCGAAFLAKPRTPATCNICRQRSLACDDCGSAHGPNGACGGGF